MVDRILLRGRVGLGLCAAIFASSVLCFVITSSAAQAAPYTNGDVFASVASGQVMEFHPDGTLVQTLDTGLGGFTTGSAFDSGGNFYVTAFSGNTVSKFDTNGNLVGPFGSGYPGSPESIVFDNSGNVYVGQPGAGGQIEKFDSAGNPVATFDTTASDGNGGTDWIDLAADQCTMHYTDEGSSVMTFNVCTNTQGPDFATGLPGPCYAHRILADGGELVACSAKVVRLDSGGNIVQTYSIPGVSALFALNLDPDGTSFWTASDGSADVVHVDIASGNVLGQFNTGTGGGTVFGLSVKGEITAAIDQPITASGTSVAATEGQSFTGNVATFTDPDTNATASEYSATINWGDGTTSTGTISGTGGNFTVSGSHTYAEEGSQTATVTITDTDNTSNQATASSQVTVADAALHATGVVPSVSGTTASGTVATFTDANPGGTLSDFTASINWGDGTTTTGSVATVPGGFAVSGSHTYAASGTYTITTTIKDAGGSTATATTTVTIPAVQVKAATKVKHGSASLAGIAAACVRAPFTVQVRGSQIASVRFTLDGARLRTKTVNRGKQYSARISVSRGAHTLTVQVKFRATSETPSRTVRRTVSGCSPRPSFTG